VFRIVHVALADGTPPAAFREQTVEVALGPNAAFPTGKVGALTRRVPADRVVTGAQPRRGKTKPPLEPKTPRVVDLLRKALAWRALLDSGHVAHQAEIACREGVTRARVTQVMSMLRLAPEIRAHILSMSETVDRSAVTERALRPIAHLDDPKAQRAEFSVLLKHAE
jgi:hypothetical protein